MGTYLAVTSTVGTLNSNSYWKMSGYVRVHVRAPSQRHTGPPPARRHPPLYCSATKIATCHHAS
ncbi:hypothetical protein E2C01_037556 [Portunus trituberculatus]|uniref:Uncharacterized protein n=1 Tax=Portunus trituberculatus TaxID=210409 RepID=A0A5B7F9N5_PORTR|nr:hypothetical protein [Portunus trituberculatus]